MMKTINICYWMCSQLDGLDYAHNELFAYTKEERDTIIDTVLDAGYNIMLTRNTDCLIIEIDTKRFQTR